MIDQQEKKPQKLIPQDKRSQEPILQEIKSSPLEQFLCSKTNF